MYPSTDVASSKPAIKSKELDPIIFIRKKLRLYVKNNNTVKDLRLLECHAHCFISLS